MRVALVTDVYLPRLGGIELHVHDLAVQFRRSGHAVTVFTSTAAPSPVNDVPVLRMPSLAGIPTSTEVLRRELRSGEYDVVHAHTSFFSPLAWRATRIAADLDLPAIVTLHSLPASEDVLLPWLLARVDRDFGPRVRWTAVSEVVARSLRKALPHRAIAVLHNGIDPAPWQQPPRLDHPLTVVSTMRLTQRKRPGALLGTLQDIRRRLPGDLPVRGVVVGAGPQGAAMVRATTRLGLDWVELPGRLTRFEIQQLYASADIYLAPAELESFGVAALEARCAGLAVVAMASGGVGEFVRDGVEGFLVDSHQEMARVASELLTDRPLLRKLQSHNRFTDPAMTWPTVVNQHVDLYNATQPALSTDYLTSGT
ncbi:glycosyltransferase involved in cell wall biosynthesis [Kribbella orskensis]|uniref:Glycosyltransferase involved in cell wall biosynthesis n=1 Tax=Kribbella orskensis TaxID=2512216 RepID=A0ABY2BNQ2_9ACTN|nr:MULTISPECIES: glycosyltransferase family 4 protein [Kribbella]TCN42181.1 glycosyltransferase involved in cell wall biosynthesis [Kribbella sp. VKM Ac-2500]TCO26059.1 glycosyltransferase involved in cell wall biosynthesis [Kribbella orskensis]